jgi:hypothetical protein
MTWRAIPVRPYVMTTLITAGSMWTYSANLAPPAAGPFTNDKELLNGRALQVDPGLNAWCQRLWLQYDELLPDFAFNFSMRHYITGAPPWSGWRHCSSPKPSRAPHSSK